MITQEYVCIILWRVHYNVEGVQYCEGIPFWYLPILFNTLHSTEGIPHSTEYSPQYLKTLRTDVPQCDDDHPF